VDIGQSPVIDADKTEEPLAAVVVVGDPLEARALQAGAERLERLEAGNETWMSMTSLAARPGTAVDPMWSMREARSPSASRRLAAYRAKRSGHAGSYSATTTETPAIRLLWRCLLDRSPELLER